MLLLDSFIFSWQKVCINLGGLEKLVGGGICGKASMWSGDGGWAGVIAGLLAIVLILWELIALAGVNMSLPTPASKISAYIGFATLVFVIIKFLLIVTNHIAFGAFIGLVFALAVGYGAWMRFQEPQASTAPPAPPAPPIA